MKLLTKAEVNSMSNEELKRLIWIDNDGQGDTSVNSIGVMFSNYQKESLEDDTYIKYERVSDYIDSLWEYTNGNMCIPIWLVENSYEEIDFSNW
jgi:hypothetical protein